MVSTGFSTAIEQSTAAGVLCAVVSVPIAYLVLDTYVVLTVSVGDTRLISHLIDAALFVVGSTAFFSGFVSRYLSDTSTDER